MPPHRPSTQWPSAPASTPLTGHVPGSGGGSYQRELPDELRGLPPRLPAQTGSDWPLRWEGKACPQWRGLQEVRSPACPRGSGTQVTHCVPPHVCTQEHTQTQWATLSLPHALPSPPFSLLSSSLPSDPGLEHLVLEPGLGSLRPGPTGAATRQAACTSHAQLLKLSLATVVGTCLSWDCKTKLDCLRAKAAR